MSQEISKELASRLTMLQRRIVDERMPVMAVFEGPDGVAIGNTINSFMSYLDPRGLRYSYFDASERDGPISVFKYFTHEPAKGQIAIFDRSWYSDILVHRDTMRSLGEGLDPVLLMERYFTDNGVILMKFFVEVKNGCKKPKEKWADSYLVSEGIGRDVWNPDTAESVMERTSVINAPWIRVKAGNVEDAVDMVVHSFIDYVEHRLQYPAPKAKEGIECIYPNPRRDADLTLTAEHYKDNLARLSKRLSELQIELSKSGRSMMLVFEGWDAAGKGGAIRRLSRALYPRGYYVVPVAAPTPTERLHTHMWRFAKAAPHPGHIVIFDRSWYGRMMVEPIEGFCSEEDYGRSAREINSFEQVASLKGTIVIKFWLEVSPEEQLNRFRDRQENPAKNYKITDEDWRNREKWDVYEEYVDRMIESTNTGYAPWVVVESEDKRYARIKVLKTVVDALERELS